MAKIKEIRAIGYQDVYNMEVDTHHNFSVAGGLIVHNCFDSLRYNLLAYHVAKTKPLPEEVPVIRSHKDKLAQQSNKRFRKRIV